MQLLRTRWVRFFERISGGHLEIPSVVEIIQNLSVKDLFEIKGGCGRRDPQIWLSWVHVSK